MLYHNLTGEPPNSPQTPGSFVRPGSAPRPGSSHSRGTAQGAAEAEPDSPQLVRQEEGHDTLWMEIQRDIQGQLRPHILQRIGLEIQPYPHSHQTRFYSPYYHCDVDALDMRLIQAYEMVNIYYVLLLLTVIVMHVTYENYVYFIVFNIINSFINQMILYKYLNT